MDLSLETVAGMNRIVSYDDKQIVISTACGETVTMAARDLILMPHHMNMSRAVDITQQQDIDFLLRLSPQLILFSSHNRQSLPTAIQCYLGAQRIGFEQMLAAAAYRTYNLLALEGREVMLVLA